MLTFPPNIYEFSEETNKKKLSFFHSLSVQNIWQEAQLKSVQWHTQQDSKVKEKANYTPSHIKYEMLALPANQHPKQQPVLHVLN